MSQALELLIYMIDFTKKMSFYDKKENQSMTLTVRSVNSNSLYQLVQKDSESQIASNYDQ